jgi:hypothetical protein
VSEYEFHHGDTGGYHYEEGINPHDPYAAPGYAPARDYELAPEYGYDEQGYYDETDQQAALATLNAYLQEELDKALEPLQGWMERQAQRDGEERVVEILDDFASSQGVELDEQTRSQVHQAADEILEAFETTPGGMGLVWQELDAIPELAEEIAAELEQKPHLAHEGELAILRTAAFAEHLLHLAAAQYTRPPANSEQDIVRRYFPMNAPSRRSAAAPGSAHARALGRV